MKSTNQSSTDACFVIPASLDPRQRTHARMPTAAPPRCAADETELMPAFCSRVPMSWKRIQRTKTNQAGNRIQSDMRQVADDCREGDDHDIPQRSQKIFHCMAKGQ